MELKTKLKHGVLALSALLTTGVFISRVSAQSDAWQLTINTTIDWLVSIMPKFGSLISGVGDYLIWPIVYVLIIIAIGGLVLTFVSAIAGLATMMLHAFRTQTKGFGGKKY